MLTISDAELAAVRRWWMVKEGLRVKGEGMKHTGPAAQGRPQMNRQPPTANCQPIPGDMPVAEGLKLGGALYHGEEFFADKVRFMRAAKNDPAGAGLGLRDVNTWADVKRVPECHQGYCWIADRIDDYRGARGPVWRRIAANDGLWIIFKRAEELVQSPKSKVQSPGSSLHPSSFILHPSFLMVKAVIDNGQREIDVSMVIAAIALAAEADERDAVQDYRTICVVCELAEQNRRAGTDEPVEAILQTARGLLADPTFERCFAESPKSKVQSPKSDGGMA